MAKNDDDTRKWDATKNLLQAMHKSIIQKDDGKGLSDFERSLVEGFGVLVGGDVDESYRKLEMMVREIMDPYVFAVMDVDEERGTYRYVYSSRPDEFPVSDDRPLPDGIWTEAVVERKQLMYTNSMTVMNVETPERAECLALGCQCYCSAPIAGGEMDKELMGVLVLLGKRDLFSEKNVQALAKKAIFFSIYMDSVRMARRHESPDS